MHYHSIQAFATMVSVVAIEFSLAASCGARTLPEPTGAYPVGRITLHLVDASRDDDQGTHKDHKANSWSMFGIQHRPGLKVNARPGCPQIGRVWRRKAFSACDCGGRRILRQKTSQKRWLRWLSMHAKPGIQITLLGTEHMSFTDMAVLKAFNLPGDGKAFIDTTRAVVGEFFGQHLLGKHSELIEKGSAKYPLAKIERNNELRPRLFLKWPERFTFAGIVAY